MNGNEICFFCRVKKALGCRIYDRHGVIGKQHNPAVKCNAPL